MKDLHDSALTPWDFSVRTLSYFCYRMSSWYWRMCTWCISLSMYNTSGNHTLQDAPSQTSASASSSIFESTALAWSLLTGPTSMASASDAKLYTHDKTAHWRVLSGLCCISILMVSSKCNDHFDSCVTAILAAHLLMTSALGRSKVKFSDILHSNTSEAVTPNPGLCNCWSQSAYPSEFCFPSFLAHNLPNCLSNPQMRPEGVQGSLARSAESGGTGESQSDLFLIPPSQKNEEWSRSKCGALSVLQDKALRTLMRRTTAFVFAAHGVVCVLAESVLFTGAAGTLRLDAVLPACPMFTATARDIPKWIPPSCSSIEMIARASGNQTELISPWMCRQSDHWEERFHFGRATVRPQRRKEKIKVLGSYRLLDGFLITKDDSICRSLRLVTVRKSLESAHAGRNLPVKEFCHLRTVNLIATVCWSVFGMKAAINYWDLIIKPLRDKEKKNECSGCPDL